jgi:multicomponent Na+:H+ antiporter subunit A
MTQILIETVTLILLVLILYHLPKFSELSGRAARTRDALIALAAGGLMTVLILVANSAEHFPPISEFFIENSVPLAHGRNIVNAILVDFRGLDTFGEITVLSLAAIGVYALLKLRKQSEKGRS